MVRAVLKDLPYEMDLFLRAANNVPDPPPFQGKGIVICVCDRFAADLWVTLRTIRDLGSTLPIELWFLGPEEASPGFKNLFSRFDVQWRDASSLVSRGKVNLIRKSRSVVEATNLCQFGWKLKAISLWYTAFEEILLLDADSTPLVLPETLFDLQAYKDYGLMLWRDPLGPRGKLSFKMGLSFIYDYLKIPIDWKECESGQILVNKSLWTRFLWLAKHLNERHTFYYNLMYGDKDTFKLAADFLLCPYWFSPEPELLPGRFRSPFIHLDSLGRRAFYHRAGDTKMPMPLRRHMVPPEIGFGKLRSLWLEYLKLSREIMT